MPGVLKGPPRRLCWLLIRRCERGEESSQSEDPSLALTLAREQPLLQPAGLEKLTEQQAESRHLPQRQSIGALGYPRLCAHSKPDTEDPTLSKNLTAAQNKLSDVYRNTQQPVANKKEFTVPNIPSKKLRHVKKQTRKP